MRLFTNKKAEQKQVKKAEVYVNNLNIFSYREFSSEHTLFLLKMSRNIQAPFAAMAHLAEGLCLNALVTRK
jgi:hypothetical protein